MFKAWLLIGLGVSVVSGAQAQVFFGQKKTEQVFDNPTARIQTKLRRPNMTKEELDGYMWNFRHDTDPSDRKIRENIVQSETTPFRSRRSVWADATMPLRSAEFGTGPLAEAANERPTDQDRIAASQLPEDEYLQKADDEIILATVYRHFFQYHARGFAKDATVYFLGQGPHKDDIPLSLLTALQADPQLKRDGITLRPASRSLEGTSAEIRDRDTGAFGAVFRVDEVSVPKDGKIKVEAAFSERDGFWFAKELTLEQGKNGWSVTKDKDLSFRTVN